MVCCQLVGNAREGPCVDPESEDDMKTSKHRYRKRHRIEDTISS